MNILYIEHYAGTPALGMEHRPYYLSKHWTEKGHSVRILASSYSHYRAKQPLIDKNGSLYEKEIINGIEYNWFKTPSYTGNGIGRVINIFTFLCKVLLKSRHIACDFSPDIVIASSTYPLDIYVAHHIARQSKARLIFELHDLWPLSPIEIGGLSPRHPFMMLCQLAENFAYKHADAVVSILPKVHDHVEAHGLDIKKLHIIPNGIEINEWLNNTEKLPDNITRKITSWSHGRMLVCYAGQHGPANALDHFIEAALLLPDICCVLVGQGPEKDRLQKLASDAENILFLDPIPKTSIPSLLSLMDVLYIGWKNTPLYRFGISPNKLIDYMMSGKPIIHAVNAGNDEVAEAKCGISILPEDSILLKEALSTLRSLSPEQRAEMGMRGHAYALAHHDYAILSDMFLTIMTELDNKKI